MSKKFYTTILLLCAPLSISVACYYMSTSNASHIVEIDRSEFASITPLANTKRIFMDNENEFTHRIYNNLRHNFLTVGYTNCILTKGKSFSEVMLNYHNQIQGNYSSERITFEETDSIWLVVSLGSTVDIDRRVASGNLLIENIHSLTLPTSQSNEHSEEVMGATYWIKLANAKPGEYIIRIIDKDSKTILVQRTIMLHRKDN